MRYIMLIYSKEVATERTEAEAAQIREAHWKVMREAREKRVLVGAEPLWASKIPTGCRGGGGCVEIRLMPGIPKPITDYAGAQIA
jgi:hypothetical protein